MTYEDVDQIIKLVEKAKALGVSEIEVVGFRVKFKSKKVVKTTTQKLSVEDVQADIKDVFKTESVLDQMSADELKYYATPYYDEIQAKKEAHAKKLAEENIA